MKWNLAYLLMAAGIALNTAEARRPAPPKTEKDNSRRRREIEEMRQ